MINNQSKRGNVAFFVCFVLTSQVGIIASQSCTWTENVGLHLVPPDHKQIIVKYFTEEGISQAACRKDWYQGSRISVVLQLRVPCLEYMGPLGFLSAS